MSASQDARQVLLEISLLAGGATQNLNASRGGGDAVGPGGDGRHMLIYWRKTFASACWGELPDLVKRARAELDGFKRRTEPLDASQDPERERVSQMLKQGQGLSVAQVAGVFGYSHKRIIDLRVIDGRDPVLGEKLVIPEDTGVKRAECERLRREGVSYRAISLRTGVALGTVHRWTNERRAA